VTYLSDNFDSQIVALLRGGAVGFMPSDTVYGLSCSALNQEAVERIYELKGRDSFKPCIVLLADIHQATELGIDEHSLEPIQKLWPAALTFVAPAGVTTPEYLHRGTSTIAVRVPKDKPLQRLLYKTGPLISTSANTQGEQTAQNVEEAKRYFGDKLDFYVDGGELTGQPSTLVEFKKGKLKILREGAVKIKSP
jgi:L-threonylcarbamoyladenylate synthase